MFFKLIAYFKFIINSTNQYGVHSPFVYKFITNGLHKTVNKSKLKEFKKYRNLLLQNNEDINIIDYKPYSKIFKGNKIKDIAKNYSIAEVKAIVLIKIITYFKPINILELGTSLGFVTTCLTTPTPNSKITIVEKHLEVVKIIQANLKEVNGNTINIVNKLDDIITDNKSFDLVFFNTNNQLETTLAYFNRCLKTAHNDSVFIFDSIHSSKEMETFWKFIISNKTITITIDLFYYGIAFFRKEQTKQHFIIRP